MGITPTTWLISSDGLFEYVSVTKDNLEGCMDIMRKSFFMFENVAIATGVHESPDAIDELNELILRAARDGVSLAAVEISTGRVVGAAVNKIEKADDDAHPYYENYMKSCKHPSSKALIQFMIDADSEENLFKLCNVDCLLEIMFLATLPEYQGKRIATTLSELSIQLAKKLLNNENVKHSITEEPLPLKPVPKLVSSISTSFVTQNLFKKLGFNTALVIPFEKYVYNGKTYASIIGHHTKQMTIDYKLL